MVTSRSRFTRSRCSTDSAGWATDAHWFSDVVGAALLGVGTTELFLYLHRQNEEHPWQFRIFPATPPVSSKSSAQSVAPTSIKLAFYW